MIAVWRGFGELEGVPQKDRRVEVVPGMEVGPAASAFRVLKKRGCVTLPCLSPGFLQDSVKYGQ